MKDGMRWTGRAYGKRLGSAMVARALEDAIARAGGRFGPENQFELQQEALVRASRAELRKQYR